MKVISNAGTPGKGLSNVMDLFSAGGGTAVASMLEALAQSDEGRKLLNRPPAAGGDQLLVQGATVPLGSQPTAPAAPSNGGSNDLGNPDPDPAA